MMEYIKSVIPDSTPFEKYVLGIDNIMLVQTGGRERTQKEFKTLYQGSGFSEFRLVCNVYTMWVMEFYK